MQPYQGFGPYIGIAGVTTGKQVDEIMRGAPANCAAQPAINWPGRGLAIGVLVSDKTLAGIPTKRPERSPTILTIPGLWREYIFNTLHYHSEDENADLAAVALRCGLKPGYGMQLNIVWPRLYRVKELRDMGVFPILQVNQAAVTEMGGHSRQLIERILSYRHVAKYVLIDQSMGQGVGLSAVELDLINGIFGEWGPYVVVAGGLGPGSMSLLNQLCANDTMSILIRRYLSVDAESNLRDEQDKLSIAKCQQYLNEAVTLLKHGIAQ